MERDETAGSLAIVVEPHQKRVGDSIHLPFPVFSATRRIPHAQHSRRGAGDVVQSREYHLQPREPLAN